MIALHPRDIVAAVAIAAAGPITIGILNLIDKIAAGLMDWHYGLIVP